MLPLFSSVVYNIKCCRCFPRPVTTLNVADVFSRLVSSPGLHVDRRPQDPEDPCRQTSADLLPGRAPNGTDPQVHYIGHHGIFRGKKC